MFSVFRCYSSIYFEKICFLSVFDVVACFYSLCSADEPVHYIDYTLERTVPLGVSFRMDDVVYEPVDGSRTMFFDFGNGERGIQFVLLGDTLVQVYQQRDGHKVAWKEIIHVVPPDGE